VLELQSWVQHVRELIAELAWVQTVAVSTVH